MAGGRAHAKALILVGLLLFGGGLSASVSPAPVVLEVTSTPLGAGEGDSTDLTLTATPNTNLKLDLPNDQPLVSAELNFAPKVLPLHSGFVWDSAADWNHADAIRNGSSVVDGALSGSSAGMLWDFNTNNQGWTFSGYGAHVTSPTCALNGSSGGSLRTYAGTAYATSPVVNLAGGANIPFHAWVRQGSSGCGEEPDSNENLAFQYKTSSNSWVTFQTYLGSTSGGSVTQFMTTLPAAAVHSTSQFRIYQNSGSGTCCDFWFVDDVHIATPPESNWTSPSMGHDATSTQRLPDDTYAPLYLEATIPNGSFLNWSILNAAGEVIPGMQGSNDLVIPLNLLDHTTVDQFRLHLEMSGSENGMPKVHSIAGDGSVRESFSTDPIERGWDLNGATYASTTGVTGGANDSITSPWVLAHAPVYDAALTGTLTNAQAQVRFHPGHAWTNVSLPYTPIVSQDVVGMQVQVVALPPADGNMSNFTTWSATEVGVDLFGGQHPARPGLDFGLDERYEWGGADARVGTWGWQDRFVNAEERTSLSLTSGSPSVAKMWVPKDDLSSFGFTFLSQSGTVNDVALFVGSTFIANRSGDLGAAGLFHLTAEEHLNFTAALGNVAASVDVLGTAFTEARVEVTGNGVALLGGLRATYNASHRVVADASSSFVMGVNEARTSVPNVGGMQAIPLPFMAEGRGGLTVELVDLVTSSDVLVTEGEMVDAEAVLTPSQRWQTVSTTYQITGSSASYYRLDVFSQAHQATWLFPSAGGAPAGVGEFDLVQLHPTDAIAISEDGDLVTTNITFRLRPAWDDEQQLTATSRAVLQNGVISIPFAHTWGTSLTQGYENDLELMDVVFSENGVAMPSTRQYLRGGESMDVSVKVGFEGLTGTHGFVDGDARLTLYRDGTPVRNTTHVDGVYWNFTETIPFTYGDVTWTVQLESLNASSVIDPAEFDRTFTVDSVKPRVIDTSMYKFDHRTPSPTQVMQVTIMDQPVLPSAMSAMVWKEWVDDTNLNGWPDEGEFVSKTMLLPSDLTALTGVYTLMLDDTAGSLGQKVAVYLEGTDPSGYAIQDAGSAAEDDHLFMYQLAVDGEPELEPDAFGWVDGRQSWLHPGQAYELNVKITEPNGGSDLSTVDVMLANNQGSDTMPIQWSFETGNCTTTSTHLIILSCTMLGSNGLAGPFEKDMVLNVELMLGWNTPDLGENRREPAILVVDRAGQEELRAFPEHRWRFSAGLSIPEESVNLHLTRGSFLGDGARVTPLTPMEISGGLVFSETSSVPEFDCQVDVLFAGQTYSATAMNGVWSIPVQAPVSSGSLPMTWEVGCLQGQGVDLTDQETSVKWIVVDGTGPTPIEVVSPRPRAILGGENHDVRVVLQELGGLDVQSLELVWVVEDFETGDTIRTGREPLTLEGEVLDGLQLEVHANMNLSEITDDMLMDRMVAKITIEGRDLAGNAVTGLNGDTANLYIATWNMEWFQPKFQLAPSSVSYSRLLMDVGDTTSIQLEVENIGTLAGTIDVVFESVTLDGTRSVIQRTNVEAEAGAIGLVAVDWQPLEPGIQWVEATLENGQTSSGPTIDVRVAEEPSFSQKVFGDVNPIIGSITVVLLIAVVLSLLIWMKRMTVNQGSKVAYDWDEYSSELEEEEPFSVAASEPAAPASAAAASTASTPDTSDATSGEGETDWVMGSDGYWWYHDKATNEWWYKDANGEIVKHP
jgi:hypothetical protein